MQQMQLQVQMAKEQATAAALQAQAAESQARANKYAAETQYTGYEAQTDRIKAVSSNLDENDKEFERRLKVADRLLKEKQIDSKIQPQPQPMGEQLNANPNRNAEDRRPNQQNL